MSLPLLHFIWTLPSFIPSQVGAQSCSRATSAQVIALQILKLHNRSKQVSYEVVVAFAAIPVEIMPFGHEDIHFVGNKHEL